MSMNRRRSLGLLFGAALVLGAGAEPAFAQVKEPLVFAAASLKNALDDVAAQWQRESGKKVTISYAASNTLIKQIEQGAPAEMNMSAGAPCSICLMRVLLAAYEMVTFLPLSRCHCAATSSSAFFKLAAANTSGSLTCANAGSAPAPRTSAAPNNKPSERRLFMLIDVRLSQVAIFRWV